MNKLLYFLLLVLCTYAGYWVGSQTWILDVDNVPHRMFNTEEARLSEVKYCNALIEGLHYFYRQDTVKWENEFKATNEYKNIETANNGEWEDFYAPEWK